ncbi:MarR family winged helix-turn-helix transcriptional regulator [Paenibacillus spongiae]|uniref:MarR family transcriptional regulator n=1 Tax=Paenibacillus spongiae TaxID=2909671 RepID=A0ABY5SI41_9BACL|nr:MarR family transcriptional regulator [Paenibacillus spongiae]UVI33125.1 MarR family transcriptional regulator [Paenibacillus spongiae]
MLELNRLLDLVFAHMRKLMFPEEWIDFDLALSKSELFALLALDRHGEIMMSQIAEHLSVPMSTASGIVDRLVKNGLIRRDRSESDRRIVVIRLSENGSALVEAFKDRLTFYLEKIDRALTEEEKTVLLTIAAKIIGALGASPVDPASRGQDDGSVRKIEIE